MYKITTICNKQAIFMQSYKTLASSSSAGENFSKEIWYTIKAGVLALVIMFEDRTVYQKQDTRHTS